jgi:hypothetical protein
MARATKAEVARRVDEVGQLVADRMKLHEIRAVINAKTSWGPTVSDATLKYYMTKSRAVMKTSANFDYDEKLGMSICRLERVITLSAAKGDQRTLLAADAQLSKLLDLRGRRSEGPLVDAETARAHLVELLAQESGDDEDTNSKTTRPRPGAPRQVKRRRGDRPGG